ncbi:MAG: helix-turn-helix transcriptional regulator [Desulfovibrio sp.]|nr:helix-turn-helix transcriptional regulator [Desulfovibrio sp.]
MPFVSNLGKLMRQKNLTYEELQFQSNVGPDTVARAKDARIATCKLLTLEKLASALDVEVSDLYRWEREEMQAPGPSPFRMG